MSFKDRLLAARESLVDRWFQRFLSFFPAESARFLARDTTSFRNPMGQKVVPALDKLFTGLVQGDPPGDLYPHLDAVIRVRAVQECTPAEAVAFVVQLKEIVWDEWNGYAAGRNAGGDAVGELRELTERIDGAALAAFDIYADCRLQIHRLKGEGLQRRDSMHPDRRETSGHRKSG